MSVHTRLVAETHLADGEVLQVAVNREQFLKLRRKTQMPVVPKTVGQYFNPEQKKKKRHPNEILCLARYEASEI
jgi:hypothetical protein